ncbi:hypothetical protein SEA_PENGUINLOVER67_94 [Mycobacterium phage PenguinLover67]|nr:hypothetical protein SEA_PENGUINLOVER67_94 [Mycobacterium phage PenguinLover67]
MKWHSERRDGKLAYVAGPWRVERGEAGKWWVARGPGIEGGVTRHDIKADAQADCEEAALLRIAGNEATVDPVPGDIAVVLADRRKDPRGRVTTKMDNGSGRPIWCIRFNVGGGRTCLFREEFEVMVP